MADSKKNKFLVFLPGVIGIYFAVHSMYEEAGVEQVSFPEIFISLFFALLYAYFIVLIVGRKGHPGGLLTASFIVIVTLFYASLRDAMLAPSFMVSFVKTFFWGKYNAFSIVVAIVLSLGVFIWCRRHAEQGVIFGKYVVIFFSLLIILDLVTLNRELPPVHVPLSYVPGDIHLEGKKPDVYFIIFDGEASSKSLERYWHYDNDSVERTFREKGFFIGEDCRSNYNGTPHSIASTLSMCYLGNNSPLSVIDEFPQKIDAGAVNVFKKNGYVFYNLSFFNVDGSPQMRSLPQFVTWGKTLPYFFYDRITGHSFQVYRSRQMELFKGTYDSLSEIIGQKSDTPRFVYAHFFIPHTPAFVDKNGSLREIGSMEPQDMNGYLDQVMYSYTVMFQLVDNILQASNGNAIIVIQGDHGYRFLKGKQKMDEQFDIFRAVYFPDKNYALFNDSTSSVNAFRIVLNSQFGATLPLLNDTSYNVLVNVLNKMQ